MRAEFNLDGNHTLVIQGDTPRNAGNPASVHLQVDYEPLPFHPAGTCPNCGGGAVEATGMQGDSLTGSQTVHTCRDCQWNGVIGRRPIIAKLLRSSEARAIASMLLSAATEARG